jgi:hypothetical protein
MKNGKPTSPSLFTFYSHFASLHRASRDIFVTAKQFPGCYTGGRGFDLHRPLHNLSMIRLTLRG